MTVHTLLAEPDGSGLLAGGAFESAGGQPLYKIARWNDRNWVSASVPQFLMNQCFILSHAQGTVHAGGPLPDCIWKFNGTNWAEIGTGVGGSGNPGVFAITEYNGDLIVAGIFSNPTNNIAAWNGVTWKNLGSGVGGWVRSAIVYDGDLIVGGSFLTAGGLPIDYLARWNGSTWQDFSPDGGANGSVLTMIEYEGDLIAAGGFTMMGDVSANHVARWNGEAWEPFGEGIVGGYFQCITIHNGDLVGCAKFDNPSSNKVVRWNGKVWEPLGNPFTSSIQSVASYNGRLYAGGLFSNMGYIAAWIDCCANDLTGNGYVEVDDLLAVINNWGACKACAENLAYLCLEHHDQYDLDQSGFVDVDDLLAIINGWGPCQ